MRNPSSFHGGRSSLGKAWEFKDDGLIWHWETDVPKSVHDRGLMKPAEVARLQRVFDETCRRREALPDSPEAREIALTLLALYNAGMVEEAMLVEAVGFRRPATKSA